MPLKTHKGKFASSAWMGVILCFGGAAAAQAQDASQSPYTPMTAPERWHDYLHENFIGPGPVIGFFASAALGQMGREPREWGLGAQGYWHRVGNHMGRAAIRGSIQSGLAAALHYDTRYHRLPGENGFVRVRHALSRTLFTQNEAGRSVVDVPTLAGVYGGDMLATYWHPHRYTPMGRGLQAGNLGIGFQAAGNLAKEFGPDLKHALLHK